MQFTGERFVPNQTDKQLETEHKQRYYSICELVRGKRVLDAACGEGYGSYILSKYAESVIGIDISPETIAHAKSTYGHQANLTFQTESVDSLDSIQDRSIDVVVSFETIEHINDNQQRAFLSEVKRVLKSDGIFILSTPDKYWYSDVPNYRNEFHVKEFYRQELYTFLSQAFKYVDLYDQKEEIVSIIGKPGAETYRFMNYPESDSITNGKYLIAISSNAEVNHLNISSIDLTLGFTYQGIKERILSLQDEVDERNRHISKLDSTIENLERELHVKQEQVHSLMLQTKELNQKLHDEIRKNQDLSIELRNKEGHIELLLEQERKLMNILNSNGWEFLSMYYKTRDALLPPNSKRKLFAKLIKKALTNPQLIRRSLTMENIRKLRLYLKTESIGMVEHRLNDYLERNSEGPRQEFKIIELQKGNYNKIIFPKYEYPKVSIIIPVYNQWHYTYACLNSIFANTKDVSYEIIIADDMSTDETVRAVEWIENVKIIRDGQNRGFLLNCNHASQYANGDYLFFLNNDTQVQEGWLSSLLDVMERDPSVGLVGSKLIYPDGRQQEAGGIIWKDASGWNYGRLDDPEKPEYNYVKEVDYISGAAILIRTSLWNQIGGFDKRFVPAYYEDSDLAFEVRRRGYKVIFQPRSVVIHFEGVSHGTDTSSGIKSYQLDNQRKFADKWKETLEREHFSNAEHVFLARDRSRGRKTILVVDHYVPHYDKDAGGRCVYQYLKLYRQMGLHVIFIGDNFYKHEPYTTELMQMGIEVLYGNWYANNIEDWLKRNGKYLDYVYLNRPHIAIKYIDQVRKYTNAQVIYFGHDLHYLREQRNFEIDPNPELLKSSDHWKKIEFELFEKADLIHVVGTYEKEIIRNQFKNKKVSNIPLFMVDEKELEKIPAEFEQRKNFLFVGGFTHKPNVDAMIWFVKEVFPVIMESLPDVTLTIAGSNPPQDILDLSSRNIHVTGYISDEKLQELYDTSRVVVVPLRYGAGVKGKVVEALIHSVPIVTTSIGAEGLQQADQVMAIADLPHQFAELAIKLYTDKVSWIKLSNRSKEYLRQFFSKDAALNIIQEDFGLKDSVAIR